MKTLTILVIGVAIIAAGIGFLMIPSEKTISEIETPIESAVESIGEPLENTFEETFEETFESPID